MWSDGIELLLLPFGLRKGENKKGESSALPKPSLFDTEKKAQQLHKPCEPGASEPGKTLDEHFLIKFDTECD